MREFTKSLFSYSLAISFFPLRQIQNVLTPKERDQQEGPATRAFSALANAHKDQFGETLGSAFRMFDNVQRGIVNVAFGLVQPRGGHWGWKLDRDRRRDHDYSTVRNDRDRDYYGSSEPVRWTDLQPDRDPDTRPTGGDRYIYDAGQLR